jgi:simple sugar transport system substrate-binding protein
MTCSGRIRLLSSAALLAVLSLLPAGCGPGGGKSDDLTIGFIYVGPKDDYGYNQAHAQGAAAVKKVPGVKVLEVEKVLENQGVQDTMKNMIEVERAKVLFPTSFGYYDPHTLEVAKKFPDIQFMHCGGVWVKGEHPTNVHTYFGYIDECQYLSGIVAGNMTESKKLGFVAAKPIPQVLRNINSFALGARASGRSNVTVHVIFTGDWSEPVKEANAVDELVKKGCDVFTCHVDSPKVVVENAGKAGKMICGYHASQADLVGDKYLTGAEWNWEKVYVDFAEKLKKGEPIPNSVRGGLKEGLVKTSPYGKSVSDAAKKEADAAKDALMKGTFVIYKGELKDNEGNVVIPAGKALEQTSVELEGMDFLVDGVVGKVEKKKK